MKWTVKIPQPSAKKMAATKTLILVLNPDGNNSSEIRFPFEEEMDSVTFEVADDYKWRRNMWGNIMDVNSFLVHVEYKNSTGTRVERQELVPRKHVLEEV